MDASVIIVALLVVILCLVLRIGTTQSGLSELSRQLEELENADSNTGFRTAGADRGIERLCIQLNRFFASLRRQKIRVESGDRALQDALLSWSHDLRTPLAAAVGYLFLLEKQPQTETARGYIQIVESRLKALEAITDDLFSIAAAQCAAAGPVQTFDALPVAEQALLSFGDQSTRRGIAFEADLPESGVMVRGSRVAATRLLFNILSNAAKYATGPIQVTLTSDGAFVCENEARDLNPEVLDTTQSADLRPGSGSRRGIGFLAARSLAKQLGASFEATAFDGRLRIEVRFDRAASGPS